MIGFMAEAIGGTPRLVDGFRWPWSDSDDDGQLVCDVWLGEWSKPSNTRDCAGRLRPGMPESDFWASDPGCMERVGCVSTAQGFEVDHVGVIIGPDVVDRSRTKPRPSGGT